MGPNVFECTLGPNTFDRILGLNAFECMSKTTVRVIGSRWHSSLITSGGQFDAPQRCRIVTQKDPFFSPKIMSPDHHIFIAAWSHTRAKPFKILWEYLVRSLKWYSKPRSWIRPQIVKSSDVECRLWLARDGQLPDVGSIGEWVGGCHRKLLLPAS